MSEENEWIDIKKQRRRPPDTLTYVDLKLMDGSMIIKALYTYIRGGFYWKEAGRELFIDEHYVKSWRPHGSE